MAAADPNVKQIKLTGGATEGLKLMQSGGSDSTEESHQDGGTRKKARSKDRTAAARRTLRVGEITKEGAPCHPLSGKGGGSTSPGTLTQLASTRVPGSVGEPEPTGTNSKLTQAGAQVGDTAPAVTSTPQAGGAAAAAKPMKVVLAAKKKPASKVILAAAKPATASAAAAAAKSDRGKTRKSSARKVRVSMKSLSRKIDKAKKIRKHATEDSLVTIKKALHKAGLIKDDSKAPEPILRQMYADFMTLKNRAL